jgi:ubiquinone/menaquinone biosynthesis C-methylase UbiE
MHAGCFTSARIASHKRTQQEDLQDMSLTVGTTNEAVRLAWVKRILAEIPAGSRILDAGAGELKYRRFCSHLRYVSLDFARYDGRGDDSGLQTGAWDSSQVDIVSDITAIPAGAASFDVIMCIEVLEHLPNPLLALGEFSRLLRSGGHLILTAPFCSLTHFAPYHYCTGFNRYFYERHLSGYRFSIVEIRANGNYFEYLAQELRRLPSAAERYANRPLRRWESLALRFVLRLLQQAAATDKESHELLCFGYHVHARKVEELEPKQEVVEAHNPWS